MYYALHIVYNIRYTPSACYIQHFPIPEEHDSRIHLGVQGSYNQTITVLKTPIPTWVPIPQGPYERSIATVMA